jgi:predicted AlkP superfamily pyrophosphatase or phosphodiesterase
LSEGRRTWWTARVTTSAAADGPIIPDYGGANVRGIIPALLGPASWTSGLPPWMPDVVASARAVVVMVLDGLGWDQLQTHRELMPTVAAMAGGSIHTVAPTTTATALTSITTGLTPAEHGLVGYRIMVGGEVMNVLRWCVGDQAVRRSHPPREVQPFEPFLGQTVPVVSVAELQSSAFSEAHLRGCDPVGWRAASSIAVQARAEVEAGERFVYCYYGGIDKIAHERGFGPFYDAELRAADRLVADVLESLPAGTALLVTSDHGQVHVGDRLVTPSAELLAAVTVQSGEGRFRWLHAAKGAVDDVAAVAQDELGHLAWVATKEQTLDEQWFGSAMAPSVRSRLGDVALVAHEPVSFDDPDDSGPFTLVCRHGSLTSAEVNVPLVGALA